VSFRKDLRRHRRELLNAKVRVAWTDATGRNRYETGRCRDISESGMRIDLPCAIDTRILVSVRVDSPVLHGSGSVRHALRHGLAWTIGVEFVGALRWRFAERRQAELAG
jgi:hypothetical protein